MEVCVRYIARVTFGIAAFSTESTRKGGRALAAWHRSTIHGERLKATEMWRVVVTLHLFSVRNKTVRSVHTERSRLKASVTKA